jgi:beta-phosphoglucomutase-like phosphatase (HAD superfamily)
MDGVLVDSHPVHRDAWRKSLATVGKIVSNEELDFILEGRRREEIWRHFLGDLPGSNIVEYGHQKDLFFQENFRDVRLISGIRKFLETLEAAALKAAIATSASAARTWGSLRRLALDGKFRLIVAGNDVEADKRHLFTIQPCLPTDGGICRDK